MNKAWRVVIKRNYSLLVSGYLTAYWMMPSPTSSFSNDLGKCFVQKILVDSIRMQLDTNQQSDSHPEDNTTSAVVAETVPPFPTLAVLSVRDVKQLIQNSPL